MITVTKKFSISYGHFLPGYSGDCAKQHGHNSEIEVEFTDSPKMPYAYPGMVVDFKDIKKIVGPIINKLDHENLNDLTPFFSKPPTAENMALYLAAEIKKTTLGPGFVRVRVSETPDSFAECRQ